MPTTTVSGPTTTVSRPQTTTGTVTAAPKPLCQVTTSIPITHEEFFEAYRATIAPSQSGEFVALEEAEEQRLFGELFESLLADDLEAAGCTVSRLTSSGVSYGLFEILGESPGPVYGIRETVAPGHLKYRGWGAALIRPSSGHRVYLAPHPEADWLSEQIALDAFLADDGASVVVFAGAHRDALGDSNGDGYADSDATHNTDNLVHVVTDYLSADVEDVAPRFIQIHGARNRDVVPDVNEPTIVASDGSAVEDQVSGGPLLAIAGAVNDEGALVAGVCGYDSGALVVDEKGMELRLDGLYTLCATQNRQGWMLEERGMRDSFMHFEIERSAREDYAAGAGPGFDGVGTLLDAIRSHA